MRTGSPRIGTKASALSLSRRDSLRWLLGGSVTFTAACSRGRVEEVTPQVRLTTGASDSAAGQPLLGLERLPTSGPWPTLDPFLFCAHHDEHYPAGDGSYGPQASLEGRQLGQDFSGRDGWSMYHGERVPGFPAHPHRGFETITVVRKGLLDHADSLGAAARYGEGDVQWLTAGAGIQHAEMFPLLSTARDNPLELFQIWLNLPARSKMVEPHFTMLWAESIPTFERVDAAGRVSRVSLRAGRWGEISAPPPPPHSWAAQPANEVCVATLELEPHAELEIPAASAGTNRALYVFSGAGLELEGSAVPVRHRATVRADVPLRARNGSERSELLLLQGRPIGEGIARRGPFVMNTAEEVREAYRDYASTGFGGWPWPDRAPVHGPRAERFARRTDGSVERPT